MISYYDTYLQHLYKLLTESDTSITVFGSSLGGFNLKNDGNGQQLYSLQEQIKIKVEAIYHLQRRKPNAKIILIGHSVGAYILLETIRHLQAYVSCNVVGGILLFPTITNIARSPSGRIAAVRNPHLEYRRCS